MSDVVPLNPMAPASRGRLEVLAEDSGMARGDAQQGDRGTIGSPTTLLPVAQRVHADIPLVTQVIEELG